MNVAIFGAPADTPNMGVSALFHSIVTNLCQAFDDPNVVLFDNGLGIRQMTVDTQSGSIGIECRGVRIGRRYHRTENLATMYQLSKLGRAGSALNANLRALSNVDVALDISGGDSFTDLYGPGRFQSVNLPKRICRNLGLPFILLPQTYGPFRDPRSEAEATATVKAATSCWARDSNSFAILTSLLGNCFDPSRHRCGVDLAFGLERAEAASKLSQSLRQRLNSRTEESPIAGLNVSGLIYNDPDVARSNYRFKADYQTVCQTLVERLTENGPVVLVPHVMSEPGHYESDFQACQDIVDSIESSLRDRVLISPNTLNQCEVKWLIGQLDWFCGTRMHSTIAGLSSQVPTATISYSDKAKGVFETCGQSNQVFDPRVMTTEEVVEAAYSSFKDREEIRRTLQQSMPTVIDGLRGQMNDIARSMEAIRRS